MASSEVVRITLRLACRKAPTTEEGHRRLGAGFRSGMLQSEFHPQVRRWARLRCHRSRSLCHSHSRIRFLHHRQGLRPMQTFLLHPAPERLQRLLVRQTGPTRSRIHIGFSQTRKRHHLVVRQKLPSDPRLLGRHRCPRTGQPKRKSSLIHRGPSIRLLRKRLAMVMPWILTLVHRLCRSQ